MNTNISTTVVDIGPAITDEFQPFLFPSTGIIAPIKLPNIIANMNDTAATAAIANSPNWYPLPVDLVNVPNIPQTMYVLATDPTATAIPIQNPAFVSFQTTPPDLPFLISPLANASIITADDCEPEFPAVSLIEDETDRAVEKAIVTMLVTNISEPACQCPLEFHIPWKPVMIT